MEIPKLRKLELSIQNDSIAILTLNIPEKYNALSPDCWDDMLDFVDFIEGNNEIRVGIINSAFEKAFCSGIDISTFSDRSSKFFPANKLKAVIDRMENSSVPIIAAVHGYCLGGGLELIMGLDLRVFADTTVISLPEVGLGIIPGAGGIQRIARVVGTGAAKELALTAKRMGAEEAYQKNLCTMVVPYESLMEETMKLAMQIAKNATLAVAYAKQAANIALDTDRHTAHVLETWGQIALKGSEDRAEGSLAFAEKRKPVFKGQ